MRILVVGVFNENSTNNGIANGFENAEHEVVRYDYREQLAHYNGDVGRRNLDIHSVFLDSKFDLVFFCKCNGVSSHLIELCSQGSKTFLWYMDPLNGNYNDELKRKIEAADYVGVAKWEVYLDARWLNSNTHFMIEGFDPKWDYPIETEKKFDVSFIGNTYGDRKYWMTHNGGVITELSDKYNTKHSEAVGQTRINLNLTGGGGISDRVYKILAARGFCLSQNYPHVEKYGLVPNEDLVLFDTDHDKIEKCKYYMNHEDERNAIAEHGYQTVQKFSRDNLAKQIVEIVNADVSPRLLRKD